MAKRDEAAMFSNFLTLSHAVGSLNLLNFEDTSLMAFTVLLFHFDGPQNTLKEIVGIELPFGKSPRRTTEKEFVSRTVENLRTREFASAGSVKAHSRTRSNKRVCPA